MEDTRLSLFESIIRFSDDAIITKDLDGIVTSWNNAACRLFGYTAEEMTGQPIARIIPPELLNEEADIISKVKAGEIIAHYETERLHKTGAIVYISLTVSPLKDKLGNILGASKIARDITRQKKDGEALQRSLKELEDYKQAIDRSSLVVITDKDGVFASWRKLGATIWQGSTMVYIPLPTVLTGRPAVWQVCAMGKIYGRAKLQGLRQMIACTGWKPPSMCFAMLQGIPSSTLLSTRI